MEQSLKFHNLCPVIIKCQVLKDSRKKENYLRQHPKIVQITSNDLKILTIFPEFVLGNLKFKKTSLNQI